MDNFAPRRLRALGCRCLGCTLLIFIFAVTLCALLFALIFRVVGTAQAAETGQTARHIVILVDQSRSVAGVPTMQVLAREVTLAAIAQLRDSAREGDTLRLVFFGAKAVTAIEDAPLLDDSLDDRVRAAFAASRSLGGTAIVEALAEIFERAPLTDVLLVSDGIPDTLDTRTPEGRTAYAELLRTLASRFREHDILLHVFLIGRRRADEWLAVWPDVAGASGGGLVEIATLDDVNRVAGALVVFAPAATPVPTLVPTVPPTPPPSPALESTPAPQPTRALAPMAMPDVLSEDTPPTWLPIVIGAGIITAAIGLILAGRSLKSSRNHAGPMLGGDEGLLEICDPQTGDLQHIELRDMVLGEVWGIGNSPHSHIRLGRETGEDEYAVLVLTPDGPLIESRSEQIWFDGQQVSKHLLFDGDDVYLGRFVIGYQNFFRRRGVSELDEEVTSNL